MMPARPRPWLAPCARALRPHLPSARSSHAGQRPCGSGSEEPARCHVVRCLSPRPRSRRALPWSTLPVGAGPCGRRLIADRRGPRPLERGRLLADAPRISLHSLRRRPAANAVSSSDRDGGPRSTSTPDLGELRVRIDQAVGAADRALVAHVAAGSAHARELAGVADVLDQLAALIADGSRPGPWG
jgi:hypothetical protein